MKKSEDRVNITKIARNAGVSLTTVSRVFNKHPYVKEEIRKKVIAAARKIGYAPKGNAVKRNIGVIVEDTGNLHKDPYLAMMLASISSQLSSTSLGMEIVSMRNLDKLEENFINISLGILYSEESIQKLRKLKNTSVILLNNISEGFSSVCSDHRQGIKIAFKYLFDHGHKRIAMLNNALEVWGNLERNAGYMEAISEAKIDFDERLLGICLYDSAKETVEKVLNAGITGIIACGEGVILRVMHELNRIGVKIPDELSLISFETAGVSEYLWPANTTVSQNFDSIAKNAITLIEKQLNGEFDNPVKIILDNYIIERDSVKTLTSQK
ncbi:MAG: hypothetical protein A2017_09650 [Lentisphaerae bacterium GWF2_44_16]|nr:MAG: hypothetical protein A2017_09650 [Lentisphaerae bacterium GWF2_44_16]